MVTIRWLREQIRQGKTIYDLPLRVTFYARVSTEKVEQQGSLENQIQYYTEFIQKNPNWTYVPGYIDEGISGTSTYKRDSFLRMIEDAKRGMFDFIITKEISRFSRNTLDSIQYTQELLDNNVGVLFQNDNINTLDSDSEFRLIVMAGVAQDEVRKLSERLKFGFRQSIKNGHVLGNNRLWGYDKKDCKLTIIPEQAEAVKLIFQLYATGNYGLRKLSQELTRHVVVPNNFDGDFIFNGELNRPGCFRDAVYAVWRDSIRGQQFQLRLPGHTQNRLFNALILIGILNPLHTLSSFLLCANIPPVCHICLRTDTLHGAACTIFTERQTAAGSLYSDNLFIRCSDVILQRLNGLGAFWTIILWSFVIFANLGLPLIGPLTTCPPALNDCQFIAPLIVLVSGVALDPYECADMLLRKGIQLLPQFLVLKGAILPLPTVLFPAFQPVLIESVRDVFGV